MATKLENLPLEMAHFIHLLPHLKGRSRWCNKTITTLLEKGLIEVSSAFEAAIAKVSGRKVISEDHADLSDGSDAKLSSVRTSSKGTSYTAPVSNIKNKTGKLRVQVYERKQNKFYYFVIPFKAYADIPASSNIDIPFELDGTPRRIPKRPVFENWWDYEKSSFIEMCTK